MATDDTRTAGDVSRALPRTRRPDHMTPEQRARATAGIRNYWKGLTAQQRRERTQHWRDAHRRKIEREFLARLSADLDAGKGGAS